MMKKVLAAALFSLTTVSTTLSPQPAKASPVVYCNYGIYSQSLAADHPNAYADGYREGQQSFRGKKAYRPRTAGGEFARGFEDGYFNRPYTGQRVVVANSPGCIAPPPVAVYNRPGPSIGFGIGFGFGRVFRR